ncbi:MAG: type II toxin-antitoxin system VapC family toxin [Knoellia sp.]
MIVLDTNVVCEAMKPVPDPRVMSWLSSVPMSSVRLTVVTVAELLKGVFQLPEGRRRDSVQEHVDFALAAYNGKVLDVDARTAPYFADIVTKRDREGRPIGVMDAWIAAVCRRHDAPFVTRNVKDFEGTGIAVINPWETA